MKLLFTLSVIWALLIAPEASAQRQLSPRQLKRIQEVKNQLGIVEKRSVEELTAHLIRTDAPESHLQILEAVAATYNYMVEKYEVNSQERRAWLYSMVQLNMAYFRLGGPEEESERDSSLNLVIRRKLIENLPKDFLNASKLIYSLD